MNFKALGQYFIVNGLYLAILWGGFVEGVKGLENIGIFSTWALAVITALEWLGVIAMTRLEAYESLLRLKAIPRWLDISYDLGILLLLTWHGAFVTAIAYLIHIFLCFAVRHSLTQKVKGSYV